METPSQSRYVGYYETMRNNGRRLPAEAPLRLTEILVTGVMYMGAGTGADFWLEVDQGRGNTVFSAVFGSQTNCQVAYSHERDVLTVRLVGSPVLRGDVRLLFQTSARNVPKNYEKCPFYLWFHTGFIRDGRLVLGREQLDNPHKSKTWHCFRQSLSVDLRFENVEE